MEMSSTTTLSFEDVLAPTNAQARDYQERIVTKTRDFFVDKGVKTVMINSPTGSGKTVMGMSLVAWLQKELNIGIGWSAMRRNLLTQAHGANNEMNMGVEDLTTISMFEKNVPTHDASGRKIDLIVVDECQHDAADSMTMIHNIIQPRFVLGLSATPFRTDKLKLCFQKVVRDAGIHQLIQLGYLSKYHAYVIPTWDVRTVTQTYLRDPELWGKSAMYWLNRTQLMECYDILRAAGVRVEFVTGDQSFAHREDILERFEQSKYGERLDRQDDNGDWYDGGIDVIVNMMVLTEGWDCPSLKTAFVRDSSKGPAIQMSGRAFRIHPDHEFKQIVQSSDTKWTIQKTATPAEAFLWIDQGHGNGEWRSVKPSQRATNVANANLRMLARTQTKMPDYILKKRGLTWEDPNAHQILPHVRRGEPGHGG